MNVTNDARRSTPEPFGDIIETQQQLREFVPAPSAKITYAKVQHSIDIHSASLIACSPYVVLSTSDRDGNCDCSPRGGPPGFIRLLDETHFIIPELSGNRRADTLSNIIDNPTIGMMVLVPGYEDFLRINGDAFVVKDRNILEKAPVMGVTPNVAIGVRVREIYMHCAKAAKRSQLWNPAAWPDLESIAEMAVILRDHTGGCVGDGTVQEIQRFLDESYSKRLFAPSNW